MNAVLSSTGQLVVTIQSQQGFFFFFFYCIFPTDAENCTISCKRFGICWFFHSLCQEFLVTTKVFWASSRLPCAHRQHWGLKLERYMVLSFTRIPGQHRASGFMCLINCFSNKSQVGAGEGRRCRSKWEKLGDTSALDCVFFFFSLVWKTSTVLVSLYFYFFL